MRLFGQGLDFLDVLEKGNHGADGGVPNPPPASIPANTIAPVVSGSLSVGSTLTTTNGTWSGSPSPTFTYQWYQDPSTPIGGATASTYVLQAGDIGLNIHARVTGTNGSGSASVNSNSVGPVTSSFTPALRFNDARNSQYFPSLV